MFSFADDIEADNQGSSIKINRIKNEARINSGRIKNSGFRIKPGI